MTLSARLLDWFSRFLETDEREAVLGDMAEEGVGLVASCLGIVDVLLCRELEAWRSWTPWVASIGVVVPCVLSLIVVAKNVADGSAIYLWLFANNSDVGLLRQPGFWSELWACLPQLIVPALAALSWSWCAGYVIGASSPRTRRSGGILVCVLVLFALTGWTPAIPHAVISEQARAFLGNAAVFRNEFYRDVLPRLILLVLVMLPVLRGIHAARNSAGSADWARLISALVLGVAVLSLVAQALYPGAHAAPFLRVGLVGSIAYVLSRQQQRLRSPRWITGGGL